MRERRAATVDPPLCADDGLPLRRGGPAPFSPPELPGLVDTTGQSDFLTAVCLSRLCGSSGILAAGLATAGKDVEDLPGCRDDMM